MDLRFLCLLLSSLPSVCLPLSNSDVAVFVLSYFILIICFLMKDRKEAGTEEREGTGSRGRRTRNQDIGM